MTQERLTDLQVGNLLAATGNSESKPITLRAMRPGIVNTSTSLQQAVWQAQGENPPWKIDHHGVYHYCERDFAPIGLVAMEVTDELQRSVGFVKTDYGITQGDSLGGLLMGYSLKWENVPLYGLFGATTSAYGEHGKNEEAEARKRAVSTRLKIFWEVLTSPGTLRTVDLEDRLGIPNVILNKHLLALAGKGIINYDSVKFGQPVTAYRLTDLGFDSIPQALRTDQPNKRPVYFDILVDHCNKWLTRDQMTEMFLKKQGIDPTSEDGQKLKGPTERSMGNALNLWVERKYLEIRDFRNGSKSVVELTPEQRPPLIDIVELIERFQEQDRRTLQVGYELSDKLTASDIAKLMKKAKTHSPYANRQTTDEFFNTVEPLLKSGGLNVAEIANALKDKGQLVSREGLRTRLNKLKALGQVKRASGDRNAKWCLI